MDNASHHSSMSSMEKPCSNSIISGSCVSSSSDSLASTVSEGGTVSEKVNNNDIATVERDEVTPQCCVGNSVLNDYPTPQCVSSTLTLPRGEGIVSECSLTSEKTDVPAPGQMCSDGSSSKASTNQPLVSCTEHTVFHHSNDSAAINMNTSSTEKNNLTVMPSSSILGNSVCDLVSPQNDVQIPETFIRDTDTRSCMSSTLEHSMQSAKADCMERLCVEDEHPDKICPGLNLSASAGYFPSGTSSGEKVGDELTTATVTSDAKSETGVVEGEGVSLNKVCDTSDADVVDCSNKDESVVPELKSTKTKDDLIRDSNTPMNIEAPVDSCNIWRKFGYEICDKCSLKSRSSRFLSSHKLTCNSTMTHQSETVSQDLTKIQIECKDDTLICLNCRFHGSEKCFNEHITWHLFLEPYKCIKENCGLNVPDLLSFIHHKREKHPSNIQNLHVGFKGTKKAATMISSLRESTSSTFMGYSLSPSRLEYLLKGKVVAGIDQEKSLHKKDTVSVPNDVTATSETSVTSCSLSGTSSTSINSNQLPSPKISPSKNVIMDQTAIQNIRKNFSNISPSKKLQLADEKLASSSSMPASVLSTQNSDTASPMLRSLLSTDAKASPTTSQSSTTFSKERTYVLKKQVANPPGGPVPPAVQGTIVQQTPLTSSGFPVQATLPQYKIVGNSVCSTGAVLYPVTNVLVYNSTTNSNVNKVTNPSISSSKDPIVIDDDTDDVYICSTPTPESSTQSAFADCVELTGVGERQLTEKSALISSSAVAKAPSETIQPSFGTAKDSRQTVVSSKRKVDKNKSPLDRQKSVECIEIVDDPVDSAPEENTNYTFDLQPTVKTYKLQYLHPSFYRCLPCYSAFNVHKTLYIHLWNHIQTDFGITSEMAKYPLPIEVQQNVERSVSQLKRLAADISDTIHVDLQVDLDSKVCKISITFTNDLQKNRKKDAFRLTQHVVAVSGRTADISDLVKGNMMLRYNCQSDIEIIRYCCTYFPTSLTNKLKCGVCSKFFEMDNFSSDHVCQHFTRHTNKRKAINNYMQCYFKKMKRIPRAGARSVNGNIQITFSNLYKARTVSTNFEIFGPNNKRPVKMKSYRSEFLFTGESGKLSNEKSSKPVTVSLNDTNDVLVVSDSDEGNLEEGVDKELTVDSSDKSGDLPKLLLTCDEIQSETPEKDVMDERSGTVEDSTRDQCTAEAQLIDTETESSPSVGENEENITYVKDDSHIAPKPAVVESQVTVDDLVQVEQVGDKRRIGHEGAGVDDIVSVNEKTVHSGSDVINNYDSLNAHKEVKDIQRNCTDSTVLPHALASNNECSTVDSIPCDNDVMSKDYLQSETDKEHLDVKPLVGVDTIMGYYKCGIEGCFNSFLHSEELTQHLSKMHQHVQCFMCFLCGKVFIKGSMLSIHLEYDHITREQEKSQSVPLLCSVAHCVFRSDSLKNYMKHYKDKHGSLETFHCFHCKSGFSSIEHLNSHLTMFLHKIVLCTYCRARSFLKSAILKHIVDCHENCAKKIAVISYFSCAEAISSPVSVISPTTATRQSVQTKLTENPLAQFATPLVAPRQGALEILTRLLEQAPISKPIVYPTAFDNVAESASSPKPSALIHHEPVNSNQSSLPPLQHTSTDITTTSSEQSDVTDSRTSTPVITENSNSTHKELPWVVHHDEALPSGTEIDPSLPFCVNKVKNKTVSHCCSFGSKWLDSLLKTFIAEPFTCKCCGFTPSEGQDDLSKQIQLHIHTLNHLNLNIHKCNFCSFKCILCKDLQQHTEVCHSRTIVISLDNIIYQSIQEFKNDFLLKTSNHKLCQENSEPKLTEEAVDLKKKAELSPKSATPKPVVESADLKKSTELALKNATPKLTEEVVHLKKKTKLSPKSATPKLTEEVVHLKKKTKLSPKSATPKLTEEVVHLKKKAALSPKSATPKQAEEVVHLKKKTKLGPNNTTPKLTEEADYLKERTELTSKNATPKLTETVVHLRKKTDPLEKREEKMSESEESRTYTFECKVCKFQSNAKLDMQLHIKEANHKSHTECNTCYRIFNGVRSVKRHLKEEHKLPPSKQTFPEAYKVIPEYDMFRTIETVDVSSESTSEVSTVSDGTAVSETGSSASHSLKFRTGRAQSKTDRSLTKAGSADSKASRAVSKPQQSTSKAENLSSKLKKGAEGMAGNADSKKESVDGNKSENTTTSVETNSDRSFIFSCSACDYGCKTFTVLDEHLSSHHADSQVKCTYCVNPVYFSSVTTLYIKHHSVLHKLNKFNYELEQKQGNSGNKSSEATKQSSKVSPIKNVKAKSPKITAMVSPARQKGKLIKQAKNITPPTNNEYLQKEKDRSISQLTKHEDKKNISQSSTPFQGRVLSHNDSFHCFKCCKCSYRCKLLSEMDQHIEEDHPRNQVKCGSCPNYVCKSVKELFCEHHKVKHGKSTFSYSFISSKGKRSSSGHSRDKNQKDNEKDEYRKPWEAFDCQSCNYKCKTLCSMDEHIKASHGTVKAMCSYCLQHPGFASLSSLYNDHHLKLHKDKVLSYTLSLGSKKKSEPKCDVRPVTPNSDTTGEDRTTMATIFKCHLCSFSSSKLNTLDSHVHENHPQAKIICTHCGNKKYFPSVTQLLLNHHNQQHDHLPFSYKVLGESVSYNTESVEKSTKDGAEPPRLGSSSKDGAEPPRLGSPSKGDVSRVKHKEGSKFNKANRSKVPDLKKCKPVPARKCTVSYYKQFFSSSESDDSEDAFTPSSNQPSQQLSDSGADDSGYDNDSLMSDKTQLSLHNAQTQTKGSESTAKSPNLKQPGGDCEMKSTDVSPKSLVKSADGAKINRKESPNSQLVWKTISNKNNTDIEKNKSHDTYLEGTDDSKAGESDEIQDSEMDGRETFKCLYCGKDQLISQPGLLYHLGAHFGHRPYRCGICDGGWTSFTAAKSHFKLKHPSRRVKIRMVGDAEVLKYIAFAKDHMNDDPAPKMNYRCTVCLFKCPQLQMIKKHLSIHTDKTGDALNEFFQKIGESVTSPLKQSKRRLSESDSKSGTEDSDMHVEKQIGGRAANRLASNMFKRTYHAASHQMFFSCTECPYKTAARRKAVTHYQLYHKAGSKSVQTRTQVRTSSSKIQKENFGKLRTARQKRSYRTTPAKSFSCVLCKDSWRTIRELQRHQNMVHPKLKVRCSLCGEVKQSIKALYSCHFYMYHKSAKFQYAYVNYDDGPHSSDIDSSTGDSVKSDSSSHALRNYSCKFCSKKYPTNNFHRFVEHLAVHLNYLPFKCPHCDTRQYHQSDLHAHMRRTHKILWPPVLKGDIDKEKQTIIDEATKAQTSLYRRSCSPHDERKKMPVKWPFTTPRKRINTSPVASESCSSSPRRATEESAKEKQPCPNAGRYIIYFDGARQQDMFACSYEGCQFTHVKKNAAVNHYRFKHCAKQARGHSIECPYCLFTSDYNFIIKRHVKQIHPDLPPEIHDVDNEPEVDIDSTQQDGSADGDDAEVYIDKAVKTEPVDESSLSYCCHICSFKTHVLADFQEHVLSPHQKEKESCVNSRESLTDRVDDSASLESERSKSTSPIPADSESSQDVEKCKFCCFTANDENRILAHVIKMHVQECEKEKHEQKERDDQIVTHDQMVEAEQAEKHDGMESNKKQDICGVQDRVEDEVSTEEKVVTSTTSSDERLNMFQCPFCVFSSQHRELVSHIVKVHNSNGQSSMSDNITTVTTESTSASETNDVQNVEDINLNPNIHLTDVMGISSDEFHTLLESNEVHTLDLTLLSENRVMSVINSYGSDKIMEDEAGKGRKRFHETIDDSEEFVQHKKMCVRELSECKESCIQWGFTQDAGTEMEIFVEAYFDNKDEMSDCLSEFIFADGNIENDYFLNSFCEGNRDHDFENYDYVARLRMNAHFADIADDIDGSEEEDRKMRAYFADISQDINPQSPDLTSP